MKKNLIVRGFFGRGNCGDEAILQTIYDLFSPYFNIVISTELNDANKEAMNVLHPYDKCEVINCEVRDRFNPKVTAGYLLGGGGLGLGLGWNQAFIAFRKDVKTIQAGVHLEASFVKGEKGATESLGELASILECSGDKDKLYNMTVAGVLSLFDYLALRNSQSMEFAEKLGIKALYRPDWVFGMKKDTCEEVKQDKKRMLVTIREYPPQLQNYDSLKLWLDKINNYAEKLGMYVKYLPFCDKDAETTRKAGIKADDIIDGEYWNPRRVKQWIANSGLMVSMGRFHATVFAISEGTPIINIDHVMRDYKNKGACLLEDSKLGKFRFDMKDEKRDIYDFFKEAISQENEMKIASIGQTNKQLVLKMRDEILKILSE